MSDARASRCLLHKGKPSEWQIDPLPGLEAYLCFLVPHPESILAWGGKSTHLNALQAMLALWQECDRPRPGYWLHTGILPYLEDLKDVLPLVEGHIQQIKTSLDQR